MKAFIDIGSNSNKLSIFDYNINKEIYSDRKVTRLGQNSFKTKILSQEGINNCILVLEEFFVKIREFNIQNIIITATSCVRDAINKDDLSLIIKEKFHCDLIVLSGHREAEIIYNGVINNIDLKENTKSLLIDIGGGSTEFILGSLNKIIFRKSLDIGAVRLYDTFFKNKSEKLAFEKSCEYVRNILKDNHILSLDFDLIIGSSGTWTNLYNYLLLNKRDLSCININNSISELLNMSFEERQKYINPDRVDIITSGGSIVKVIIDDLKPNKLNICDYSLKEGLIYEYR